MWINYFEHYFFKIRFYTLVRKSIGQFPPHGIPKKVHHCSATHLSPSRCWQLCHSQSSTERIRGEYDCVNEVVPMGRVPQPNPHVRLSFRKQDKGQIYLNACNIYYFLHILPNLKIITNLSFSVPSLLSIKISIDS